jgi:hypothetical protein
MKNLAYKKLKWLYEPLTGLEGVCMDKDKLYIVIDEDYEWYNVAGYTTSLSDAVKMAMNDNLGCTVEEIPFIEPKDNSDTYVRYYAFFDVHNNIVRHGIWSLDKYNKEYKMPERECFGNKVRLKFSIKASQLDDEDEIKRVAYEELKKAEYF